MGLDSAVLVVMVVAAAGHRDQEGGVVESAVDHFVEPGVAALNHQEVDQGIQEVAAIGFAQGVRGVGDVLVEPEGKGGHPGVEVADIPEGTVQKAGISLREETDPEVDTAEAETGPETDIVLGADTLDFVASVAADKDSPGKADHVTVH